MAASSSYASTSATTPSGPSPPESIKVTVRTLDGVACDFVVSPNDKVSHLKFLISQSHLATSLSPLPPATQRLVYSTKEMLDDDVLKSYNVENGSGIGMSLKDRDEGLNKMEVDLDRDSAAVSSKVVVGGGNGSSTAGPIAASSSVVSPTPPVKGKGKKRCNHNVTGGRCTKPAMRMNLGDCPKCSKEFCQSHRLPEDHACEQMEGFRSEAFKLNKEKLEKERTSANKLGLGAA